MPAAQASPQSPVAITPYRFHTVFHRRQISSLIPNSTPAFLPQTSSSPGPPDLSKDALSQTTAEAQNLGVILYTSFSFPTPSNPTPSPFQILPHHSVFTATRIMHAPSISHLACHLHLSSGTSAFTPSGFLCFYSCPPSVHSCTAARVLVYVTSSRATDKSVHLLPISLRILDELLGSTKSSAGCDLPTTSPFTGTPLPSLSSHHRPLPQVTPTPLGLLSIPQMQQPLSCLRVFVPSVLSLLFFFLPD